MTRSSQAFRLERDMYPALTSSLDSVLGAHGMRLGVLREPTFGGVIPDLLVGVAPEMLPGGISIDRWPHGIYESFILDALTSVTDRSPESVRRSVGLPTSSFRRALRELVRAGLVCLTDDEQLMQTPLAAAAMSVELIAVEAKLSRWREALAQAIDYKDFTDRVYVALDAGRIELTQAIQDEFEGVGVGLLLCTTEAVTAVIDAPRRAIVASPARTRAALMVNTAFQATV